LLIARSLHKKKRTQIMIAATTTTAKKTRLVVASLVMWEMFCHPPCSLRGSLNRKMLPTTSTNFFLFPFLSLSGKHQ
jgi:hypothetical protein